MLRIQELVRDLAVVAVLAAFLDMLLPNGRMRRFARVVTGLFVLLLVISPLLPLVSAEKNWDLDALFAEGEADSAGILAAGEALRAEWEAAAADDYAAELAAQLSAELAAREDVAEAETALSFSQLDGVYQIDAVQLRLSGSIPAETAQSLAAARLGIDAERVTVELR